MFEMTSKEQSSEFETERKAVNERSVVNPASDFAIENSRWIPGVNA